MVEGRRTLLEMECELDDGEGPAGSDTQGRPSGVDTFLVGDQLLSDLFQLELMLYTPRFKTTCERVSSFTRDLSSRRD